jgi:hypothetical protein
MTEGDFMKIVNIVSFMLTVGCLCAGFVPIFNVVALQVDPSFYVDISHVRWEFIDSSSNNSTIVICLPGGAPGLDSATPFHSTFLTLPDTGEFDVMTEHSYAVYRFNDSNSHWLKDAVNWARKQGYSTIIATGFSAGANVWMYYVSGDDGKREPVTAIALAGIMDAWISQTVKNAWSTVTVPAFICGSLDSHMAYKDVSEDFYNTIRSDYKLLKLFPIGHDELREIAITEITQWIHLWIAGQPPPPSIIIADPPRPSYLTLAIVTVMFVFTRRAIFGRFTPLRSAWAPRSHIPARSRAPSPRWGM